MPDPVRVWRPIAKNTITVGPHVGFHYSTIQAALDALASSPPNGAPSASNWYEIEVAPGEYVEKLTVDEGHRYTVLRGAVRDATIVRYSTADTNPTIKIAGDSNANEARHFVLENIRVVRDGLTDVTDENVEAVRVGNQQRDVLGDSFRAFDEIVLDRVRIEGQCAGLVVNGQVPASPDPAGIVRVLNSRIEGGFHGATYQDECRVVSSKNLYRVAAGLPIASSSRQPKVCVEWFKKGASDMVEKSFHSAHDVLEVIGDLQGGAGGAPLNLYAGFYFNSNAGAVVPPTITAPFLYMEHADAAGSTFASRSAGFLNTTALDVPVYVSGGHTIFRQLAAAADLVEWAGATWIGAGSQLDIYGHGIHEQDEGSSTKYSLKQGGTGTINARCYSNLSSSGSITAITEVPV